MQKFAAVKDKASYKNDLSDLKEKLEKEVVEMPYSIANKHRRWRYQSDIE